MIVAVSLALVAGVVTDAATAAPKHCTAGKCAKKRAKQLLANRVFIKFTQTTGDTNYTSLDQRLHLCRDFSYVYDSVSYIEVTGTTRSSATRGRGRSSAPGCHATATAAPSACAASPTRADPPPAPRSAGGTERLGSTEPKGSSSRVTSASPAERHQPRHRQHRGADQQDHIGRRQLVGQRRQRDRPDHRGAHRRIGQAEGAPQQARGGGPLERGSNITQPIASRTPTSISSASASGALVTADSAQNTTADAQQRAAQQAGVRVLDADAAGDRASRARPSAMAPNP